MPPRKKARVSLPDTPAAATPATNTATATAPAQQSEAPPKPGCDPESLVADPWSAEQETALLKGVIKWKPVGLYYPSPFQLPTSNTHTTYSVDLLNPELINLALGNHILQDYTSTFVC